MYLFRDLYITFTIAPYLYKAQTYTFHVCRENSNTISLSTFAYPMLGLY